MKTVAWAGLFLTSLSTLLFALAGDWESTLIFLSVSIACAIALCPVTTKQREDSQVKALGPLQRFLEPLRDPKIPTPAIVGALISAVLLAVAIVLGSTPLVMFFATVVRKK